ncbi:MAG: hypothetical protein GYB31_11995 [Bacteroidetes bacterium]|nr:hypothetical protein [Bacteroidota bacterium]
MADKIRLKNQDQALVIEFDQKKPPRRYLGIALLMFLITFSLPVLVILKGGFSFGTILSAILFGALAYYFFRLFLWNWKGRELVSVGSEYLTHELDYGLFRDSTPMKYPDLSIEIRDPKARHQPEGDEKILDSILADSPESGFICFVQDGEILLEVNAKLHQPELDRIAGLIKREIQQKKQGFK